MDKLIAVIIPEVIGKKITIYDYDDTPVIIETPGDKVIESIHVVVLSGDETGEINFTDGTRLYFDASDCRMQSYYDGDYVVPSEKVQSWIDFKPRARKRASYDRMNSFS